MAVFETDSKTPVRPRTHANRRREGYEMTHRQDVLPILLGSGTAAVLLHVLLYFLAPYIPLSFFRMDAAHPERVTDELLRVIVREAPEEPYDELDDTQEPTEEPQEIENIDHEPVEIDILDIDVEELTMAPGETDLSVPAPAAETPAEEPDLSATPTELDARLLEVPRAPDDALTVVEPAPVNSNLIVANVTPHPDDLNEAEAQLDRDLKQQAADGNAHLPADTRTLGQLMGEKELGASSGVARIGTDLLFAFGKCELKNSARITMQQLAALILKNPKTNFIIEGHTDGEGGAAYNAFLSLQRAAAVRAWLVKNKIPTTHVYVRACGSKSPLVSTQGTREQQAPNRRVEIHMRKASEGLPSGCLEDSYSVDLKTPITEQIAKGARVPAVHESVSQSKPAAAPKETSAARSGPSSKPSPSASKGRNPSGFDRIRRATSRPKKK